VEGLGRRSLPSQISRTRALPRSQTSPFNYPRKVNGQVEASVEPARPHGSGVGEGFLLGLWAFRQEFAPH